MWGRKSAEDELWDTLVEVAQPALKEADEAVPILDRALAELPDIDGEGKIRRARDVLAESSVELRKQLKVAIGPETIRGVKKYARRIWDAIDATEDIRIRTKLVKDAFAFSVAGAVDTHRLGLEGLRRILQNHDEALQATGLEELDPLTKEIRAYAIARLTSVKAGDLYGATAGQDVSHPVLDGTDLLSGPTTTTPVLPAGRATIQNLVGLDLDDE